MRRLLFSFLAMTFLGTLVGCHATHGVCDCSSDFDDHCASRHAWVNGGASKTDGPAAMPDVREPLPAGPKKL